MSFRGRGIGGNEKSWKEEKMWRNFVNTALIYEILKNTIKKKIVYLQNYPGNPKLSKKTPDFHFISLFTWCSVSLFCSNFQQFIWYNCTNHMLQQAFCIESDSEYSDNAFLHPTLTFTDSETTCIY